MGAVVSKDSGVYERNGKAWASLVLTTPAPRLGWRARLRILRGGSVSVFIVFKGGDDPTAPTPISSVELRIS